MLTADTIRRLVVALVILCTMAFVLPPAAIPSSASDRKVEVTIMAHMFPGWNELHMEQLRRYEKLNPDVVVKYISVPTGDLYTKLVTSLSAGTAADIMGVYGPWVPDLVAGGWIDAAPEFVLRDMRENCIPYVIESGTFDGEVYGYVQHIGVRLPIVNTTLFEEEGLPLPKTWEDLVEAGKRLDKRKDGRLVQAGTSLHLEGSNMICQWMTVLGCYGVQVLSSDGKRATFNTEKGVAATKTYVALTRPGFTTNPPVEFMAGKSAAIMDGPWMKGVFEADAPKVRFRALPALRQDRQHLTAYAWFWVVNAKSSPEVKEQAWKVIGYLNSNDNQLEVAKVFGLVPFRKGAVDSLRQDEWFKVFVDALEVAKPYPKVRNWEKIESTIRVELERAIQGEISVEAALDRAESNVNRELGLTRK